MAMTSYSILRSAKRVVAAEGVDQSGDDRSYSVTVASRLASRLLARSSPLFRPDFGVEWRQAT